VNTDVYGHIKTFVRMRSDLLTHTPMFQY